MENLTNTYQEAIKKIAANLNLKYDIHSQDWEYESADSNRIEEFLGYYINNKLNSIEKIILLKILLESYNDYVIEKGFNSYYSKKLKEILKNENALFKDIIKYWSCEGEELEDSFYITPFIREVAKSLRYNT